MCSPPPSGSSNSLKTPISCVREIFRTSNQRKTLCQQIIKLQLHIAPQFRVTHLQSMAEPARSGREKQRYDGDTRLVAGCLPVMPDGRVLLIGSVTRTDWVLPKGGWEDDETSVEAAVREAYEEAGVRTERRY